VHERRTERANGQPTTPVDLSEWRRAAAEAARAAGLPSTPPRRPASDMMQPGHAPLRRWLRRAVLAVVGLGLFGVLSLGLLAYSDFAMAANGSSDARARAQWVWDHGDHLHFAVHVIQARLLDICPCTRRAADAQYYYAHFHALTPRQQAIAANHRPTNLSQWVDYVTSPFIVGLEWAGDGIAWLGGRRPPTQVAVALDQYAVQPAEIHIPRGTTVTWRNVDQLGEAHTVTADQAWQFQSSDWLEPGESYQFTFTERGQYAYYCQAHGGPGGQGMSGVIIVD
jgi:plastocyanin